MGRSDSVFSLKIYVSLGLRVTVHLQLIITYLRISYPSYRVAVLVKLHVNTNILML